MFSMCQITSSQTVGSLSTNHVCWKSSCSSSNYPSRFLSSTGQFLMVRETYKKLRWGPFGLTMTLILRPADSVSSISVTQADFHYIRAVEDLGILSNFENLSSTRHWFMNKFYSRPASASSMLRGHIFFVAWCGNEW